MRLKAPDPLLSELRSGLLAETEVETCFVGFTHQAGEALILGQIEPAPANAYLERTGLSALLKPEYVSDVAGRARRGGLGCVFAHSHPFDTSTPSFSDRDDDGESRLARFLAERVPGADHVALVASPGGMRARVLGTAVPMILSQVGSNLVTFGHEAGQKSPKDRYDRQIRAFGQAGQERLARLHVGVVGAGGTGTAVIQQLGHLGVSRFTLVDFDPVEETNLNRLIGAGPEDVGRPKVEVAERMLARINPEAEVGAVEGDVADDDVAKALLGCDLVFLCTDSHASRAIVSQIAYQYLIPTIDMGVSISVRDGRLVYVTGRVQLLAPGLPCLQCMELLDSEQIRREMLTPEARAADPYIQGFHEPQPSVVSLNATMASLAVTMFLGVVTDAPVAARIQIYDGLRGTVRPACASRDPACLTCSTSGAFARGDSWRLPTRPGR